MANYDNETMLKVLIQSDEAMIKGIVDEFKLQLNKSFIRVLINEYNVLVNTSTNNSEHKNELNSKITKLHLIDDIMNKSQVA